MLDIGIIIPELAKYGGAERLLAECLARWQHRHDITIYTTRLNREVLDDYQVDERVRVVELTPYFDGPHSFVLNGTLLPKIWEQEIGRHQVYHGHLWPTNLVDRHPMVWYPHEPPRMLQDLRYSQPIDDSEANKIWRVHCYPKFTYDEVPDAEYEAALNTLALFDKLGQPDCIVANSHYTAEQMREIYGRKKIEIVYPGVVSRPLTEIPLPNAEFLTVGQLWPHKRTKTIVEAMSQVPQATITIVGDGPERPELERMAQSLGVRDRIHFEGTVTNEKLAELYRRCLGVVFAAFKEPFGIAPLEALAYGRPLIAAGEGGYTEILEDACCLRTAARPDQLAQSMQYLLDHPQEAVRMGQSGHEIAKRYSWDDTAESLLAIIEKEHADWQQQKAAGIDFEGTQGQRPLFGVQYYCWYGNGAGSLHWNDDPRFGGVTDMPSLGYYASTDGATIGEQLEAMETAGLDFVVLNLHVDAAGVNERELACVTRVFQVARQSRSSLSFALQLCPYDAGAEQLVEALRIARGLAERESYLRLAEAPILFLFWTGVFDRDEPTVNLIREHTEGFVRIASSLRLYDAHGEAHRTFGLFDGWSLFSPLELAGEDSLERIWEQAYEDAAAGAKGLRLATISPGYDDSHLLDPARADNRYRTVERRQGETYRKMMDFVLGRSVPPDMVLVSTFNEYHENTHIEASHNYGTLYMDMTGDFVLRAKRAWSRSEATIGSGQKRADDPAR